MKFWYGFARTKIYKGCPKINETLLHTGLELYLSARTDSAGFPFTVIDRMNPQQDFYLKIYARYNCFHKVVSMLEQGKTSIGEDTEKCMKLFYKISNNGANFEKISRKI